MSETAIFSDTFLAMGAHCDVVLPGLYADAAKETFQFIKKEVEQIEHTISRFSPVATIWELNQAPKGEWLSVPTEIWEPLMVCYDFYQMSNGAFDITLAPLYAVWTQNENPSEEELSEARVKCGFDKVELDMDNHKIRFTEEGMEFDFAAIEKAIALDVLKALLKEKGITNCIVSFEEDSVLAMGEHPAGQPWPLGIRNQMEPNDFAHVFAAQNETLNSIGTVYIRDDGQGMKPRKVINPASGQLVEGRKTVSVKAESAVLGAFIANSWLILPENDKAILSDKFSNVEILETTYTDDDVHTKLSILEGEE